MTQIYNRQEMRERRRELRTNATPAETLLWQHLRRDQLEDCTFRRQYSVGAFVLDLYSPEIRLAIEIDGSSHDSTHAKIKDEARQQLIEEHKIEFLRLTNEQVLHRTSDTLQTIGAAVQRRRAELKRSKWYGQPLPSPPLLQREGE